MRVLALDPGERVGWASGVIADGLEVTGHGMAYLKDAALQTHSAVVEQRRYDAVVVEGFWLTAHGAKVLVGSDLQPSQFLGMVRLCCWLAGVPIHVQQPRVMASARKSMRNDLPGAAQVRDIVAKADAVSHDDGHDGSATLHLWHHFFERYV